ncbi:hypothetical protein Barb4_01634 [Bacteroidales bacterium Barb4]|nr:hypothetical protein Barb4_01634 [Bacteroidales bacterium Barb4]
MCMFQLFVPPLSNETAGNNPLDVNETIVINHIKDCGIWDISYTFFLQI